jgi:hypothetical protein
VIQNDQPNFAHKGAVVAEVPTGAGIMVMANRDVHLFENEIDQNQTAAVLLVAYTKAYDDLTYNPLPRDIVVRDNKIGRNGWDPQFPGGPILAKAMGGTLPPVIWDGVSNFTRKGQATPEVVKVRLMDGPVANLHFAQPGAIMSAKPEVKPTFDDGALAEPKPVVLPKAQAGL